MYRNHRFISLIVVLALLLGICACKPSVTPIAGVTASPKTTKAPVSTSAADKLDRFLYENQGLMLENVDLGRIYPAYQELRDFFHFSKCDFFAYFKDKKLGFINDKLEVIVPANERANYTDFEDGRYFIPEGKFVTIDGKEMKLFPDGRIIDIEILKAGCVYEKFGNNNIMIQIKEDTSRLFYIADSQGNKLSADFSNYTIGQNEIAYVEIPMISGGRYIDSNGKELYTDIYKNFGSNFDFFVDGITAVSVQKNDSSRSYLVNEQGKILLTIPDKYSVLRIYNKNLILLIRFDEEHKKYIHFINSTGKTISSEMETEAWPAPGTTAIIYKDKENGKHGLIAASSEIHAAEYDNAYPYQDDTYWVTKNGQSMVVDNKNVPVFTPPAGAELKHVFNDGEAVYKLGDRYYYADAKGKVLFNYKNICDYEYFEAQKNFKVFYDNDHENYNALNATYVWLVDKNGKVLIKKAEDIDFITVISDELVGINFNWSDHMMVFRIKK